jgi:hypothetical protein
MGTLHLKGEQSTPLALLHDDLNTCCCQFTDLSAPTIRWFWSLSDHFASIDSLISFGWSHFEQYTLVALHWISSLSSAFATELLMASTTPACGPLPVNLF